MNRVTSEDVIDFWLGGEPDSPGTIAVKRKIWFSGGEELDSEIRARFEPALASIVEGSGAPWKESPTGRLAAIIVLDQFSRNIYRSTARAFSQDALAQEILREGLDRGDDQHLSFMARAFFYMPFLHAEDRSMQERVVELMSSLLGEAPESLKEVISGNLEYAVEHCDVVTRFGRFPHRNELLGRTSSAEEQAYLDAGAQRYGQ